MKDETTTNNENNHLQLTKSTPLVDMVRCTETHFPILASKTGRTCSLRAHAYLAETCFNKTHCQHNAFYSLPNPPLEDRANVPMRTHIQ